MTCFLFAFTLTWSLLVNTTFDLAHETSENLFVNNKYRLKKMINGVNGKVVDKTKKSEFNGLINCIHYVHKRKTISLPYNCSVAHFFQTYIRFTSEYELR